MESLNFEIPITIIKVVAIGVDVGLLLLLTVLIVDHLRNDKGE